MLSSRPRVNPTVTSGGSGHQLGRTVVMGNAAHTTSGTPYHHGASLKLSHGTVGPVAAEVARGTINSRWHGAARGFETHLTEIGWIFHEKEPASRVRED